MSWIKNAVVVVNRHRSVLRLVAIVIVAVLVPRLSFAQASPWENAVNILRTSFTGAIARGLSLVAIVIGGLLFAFGEGTPNARSPGLCSVSAWPSVPSRL